MKRSRGRLVFKARTLLYHSTKGMRVKKKRGLGRPEVVCREGLQGHALPLAVHTVCSPRLTDLTTSDGPVLVHPSHVLVPVHSAPSLVNCLTWREIGVSGDRKWYSE